MTNNTRTILLTGATGNVGSELAKQLAAKGFSFKALVRTADNADNLKTLGAELIIGDLADPESLAVALQGVTHAFLLTNSSEQAETLQSNFVKAAATAGVQHIVKLSQYAARIDSPVRFLRYHAAIEQEIIHTGMQYTFLRPNLYMQGVLAFKDAIRYKGEIYAAIGEARISAVDIRDIAAVAVAALTTPGHENKIYNITGAEAITHAEMAATFTTILGKQVSFIDISPAQMREALQQVHFPEWQIEGLIEDYAHYARGEAAKLSNAVQVVTGNAPRSFKDFAADYRALFL